MAKLSNTDGFHLHGWMVTELHLKGGDLFIYAVVHQFSQSDAGIYKGGVPYLCSWTGWSPNTIRKYLRSLERAGLIKSERGDINGVPFCYYKAVNVPTLQNLKDTPQELKEYPSKSDVPTLQNLSGEYNNRNRKKEKNTTPIIPSVEEVAEHARKKGFADPEGFASYYVEYNDNREWIAANGKPIIGWKNNINNNWMKFKSQVFASANKTYQPKFNYQ